MDFTVLCIETASGLFILFEYIHVLRFYFISVELFMSDI